MMNDLRTKWDALKLRGAEPGQSRYTMAFQSAHAGVRIYLAMRWPEETPSILFEAPSDSFPKDGLRFRTRAFTSTIDRFEGLPDGSSALALDLQLLSFADEFSLLALSVMDAASVGASAEQVVAQVAACIARWRRFFERGGGLLTAEEQRGLLGELIVLGRLAKKRNPEEAISGWAAPGGAVRDFELSDITIEVKTYQAATGASLRINDPAQLDEGAGRPLYVAAIRMSESTEGVTLPDAVSRVRELFLPDGLLAEAFDDALSRYGFLREHARHYGTKLIAGPLSLHAVVEGFPRIKPQDVMPGVDRVQFSVPLGAMTPFRREPGSVLGASLPGVEGEDH